MLLLLKAIKCLLYYLACNKGMCVMFIKVTFGLCTSCFVAMGSSRMVVSRTKVFYFIKDLHQVHTCIIIVLPFQCCVVLLHINTCELGWCRLCKSLCLCFNFVSTKVSLYIFVFHFPFLYLFPFYISLYFFHCFLLSFCPSNF